MNLGLTVGGQSSQVQLVVGNVLGNGLGILTGLHHSVADPESGALRQSALVHQVFHHYVGQGDVGGVHTINAQQTADGTLHGHGGAAVDETLGVVRNPGSVGAGLFHQLKIKVQLGFQHRSLPFFVSSKAGGSGPP